MLPPSWLQHMSPLQSQTILMTSSKMFYHPIRRSAGIICITLVSVRLRRSVSLPVTFSEGHSGSSAPRFPQKACSQAKSFSKRLMKNFFLLFIQLHEKFLQFDWLRAVVFQLNLKYLHVKITKPLRVVV